MPAAARRLGGRQRRGDAVAGVARLVAGVAVVEIQVANHHAVGEGGQVQTALLAAAQHGDRVGAGNDPGHLPRHPGRLAVIAAQSAADGVDDEALGEVNRLGWQVLVAERRP